MSRFHSALAYLEVSQYDNALQELQLIVSDSAGEELGQIWLSLTEGSLCHRKGRLNTNGGELSNSTHHLTQFISKVEETRKAKQSSSTNHPNSVITVSSQTLLARAM